MVVVTTVVVVGGLSVWLVDDGGADVVVTSVDPGAVVVGSALSVVVAVDCDVDVVIVATVVGTVVAVADWSVVEAVVPGSASACPPPIMRAAPAPTISAVRRMGASSREEFMEEPSDEICTRSPRRRTATSGGPDDGVRAVGRQ